MKPPPTPPIWTQLFFKFSEELKARVYSDIVGAAAKDHYLHWDDQRRRPVPAGHTQESWWVVLKMRRMPKMRGIPLKDGLNCAFNFSIPDIVAERLHKIDRSLGFAVDLPQVVISPDSRDQYVISALIQESITSSQLEGAVTTREVAKELLRTGRRPRDTSERMILNNYATMQRIRSMRENALTPDLVMELHALVTESTLDKPDAAGRLRRGDENVRIEDMEGTIFHERPAADELAARMKEMCDFANGETPDFFIHPVIRAIMLHFWLAYDHPFVDGNGRTARALFYWSMLRAGYTLFEFISISQILLRAPVRYAKAFLHTETDENDLTYFILHQTEVIEEAVQALHDYVTRKTVELREAEHYLRGLQGLNHRQQALLAHALLQQPSTRYLIVSHQRSHGVSFQTARNDLFDLRERGLLVSRKEGRSNAFYAPGDLGDKLARLAAPPDSSDQATDATLPLNLRFRARHD
jgi:Fic family protein